MFKKIYEWTAKIREKLSEKGQGMVEYALILAAVAIIAVAAIWGTNGDGQTDGLKKAVTTAFSNATTQIEKGNQQTGTTTTTPGE